MKRFEGECHFIVKMTKSLYFQHEKLKRKLGFYTCCDLCAKHYRCHGKCPAGNAVLIKIKYFECYKKWNND